MTDALIQNAIASSVVGLTRHVMEKYDKPDAEAYRTVYDSELFKLLSDANTRLFLSTNKELGDLLDAEIEHGRSALYALLA